MDGHRFDQFTRSLGHGASRRRVLAALAGVAFGTLGLRRARADWTDNPIFGWVDWTGTPCGDAGITCPLGYDCIDDPNDDCDPAAGGVDCPTTCQPSAPSDPCATVRCEDGFVCCAECGGTCEPVDPPPPGCAAILCEEGSDCCENCGGICVPIGTVCSDDLCGEPCNAVTCAAGEFCCNESCSICAPIGGACTQQFCE